MYSSGSSSGESSPLVYTHIPIKAPFDEDRGRTSIHCNMSTLDTHSHQIPHTSSASSTHLKHWLRGIGIPESRVNTYLDLFKYDGVDQLQVLQARVLGDPQYLHTIGVCNGEDVDDILFYIHKTIQITLPKESTSSNTTKSSNNTVSSKTSHFSTSSNLYESKRVCVPLSTANTHRLMEEEECAFQYDFPDECMTDAQTETAIGTIGAVGTIGVACEVDECSMSNRLTSLAVHDTAQPHTNQSPFPPQNKSPLPSLTATPFVSATLHQSESTIPLASLPPSEFPGSVSGTHPPFINTRLQGEWEKHTKGFGSRMLARMGYVANNTKSTPHLYETVRASTAQRRGIGYTTAVPSGGGPACQEWGKELILTEEQFSVVYKILRGENVFFTGAAGTGKSFILQILGDVYTLLGKRNGEVAFTASTGVAACNINGCTLHSWSGIQTGAKPLHKLWPSARVTKHWNSAETLIIDEISMISDEIFDLVANFGAKVRGNSQYFGGTQVVICGDFFQLPPVGDNDVKYCFESKIFQLLFNSTNIIILDKVYRQADGKFQSYLQQIRRGVLTLEVEQVLQTRSYFDVDNAVRLYPRNKEVDALNESKLGEICSDIHEFVAKDEYLPANKLYFDELISGIKAVHTLRLKIGAQVMLIKNVSVGCGLANGTTGTVTGFHCSEGRCAYPIVEFDIKQGSAARKISRVVTPEVWKAEEVDLVKATRTQVPLILAWAISIHKSQGLTIPRLHVSFDGIFANGQAYVALSRATDLAGLTLDSLSKRSIRVDPRVLAFYSGIGYTRERYADGAQAVSTSVEALAGILSGGSGYKAKAPIVPNGAPNSPIAETATSANAPITPISPITPSSLTEEQRRRIEGNRQRALQKMRQSLA